MSSRLRQLAGSVAPNDGSYRAWLTCQQGEASNLKIVPAASTSEKVRYIPYLQPITIEYSPDTGQLCLICHGTTMMIFLEGRGLEELADLIGEKRIRAIHVYDSAKYTPPPDNQAAVVTRILIESKSN